MKELLNHIQERIEELYPEITSRKEMMCGPLVSIIALEVIFKKRFDVSLYKDNFYLVKAVASFSGHLDKGVTAPFQGIAPTIIPKKNGSNADGPTRIDFLENNFCVVEQIGYIPSSKSVVITADYKKFLESRFLDFRRPSYFKRVGEFVAWIEFFKEHDIECKSSLKNVLDICEIYYPLSNKKNGKSVSFKFKFYADMILKGHLKDFVSFTKMFDGTNWNNIICDSYSFPTDLVERGYYLKLNYSNPENEELIQFFKKNLNSISRISSISTSGFDFCVMFMIINALKNKKGTINKNIKFSLELGLDFLLYIDDNDFFNKEISESKIKGAISFLNDIRTNGHHRLINSINKFGMIYDFYWVVDFITEIKKQEDDTSFFGFLEVLDYSLLVSNKPITQVSPKEVMEIILMLYEREKKAKSQPLVDRLDLSEFKMKKYVRELVSTFELQNEGNDLNHCVGGYSAVVKNKASKIFSFSCNKRRSTLEVCVREGHITEVQHKSTNNKNPHWWNRKIAKYFIDYLNRKGYQKYFS